VLSHAQPFPILMVVLSVVGSLLARALRWQVYFLPQRRVPFRPLLSTLTISYMASTFLPFRAGELVRAVFLGQREALPVPRIVGTILLEKLFDFLAIGGLLVVLLAMAPDLPIEARLAGQLIVAVILVGFGCVVGLAVWRDQTLRVLQLVDRHLPFRVSERLRLDSMARQFAEGTDSLRDARLWVPLLGWTTVTWVLSIVGGWAGTAALDLRPSLAALIFLSVLPSAGQAVPSSPGYVGVYHAAAVLALTSFGIDQVSAFGTAVLIHAFSYGILVVLGLAALWVDGYTVTDLLVGVRGSGLGVGSSPDRPPQSLTPNPQPHDG
jgi:glycosyltransferase 2 family protein